jgi:hypothetical protein
MALNDAISFSIEEGDPLYSIAVERVSQKLKELLKDEEIDDSITK